MRNTGILSTLSLFTGKSFSRIQACAGTHVMSARCKILARQCRGPSAARPGPAVQCSPPMSFPTGSATEHFPAPPICDGAGAAPLHYATTRTIRCSAASRRAYAHTQSFTKHLERANFFGIRVLQNKPSYFTHYGSVQNFTHSLDLSGAGIQSAQRCISRQEIPILHLQTWLEHEPFPSAQTPSCSSLGPGASSPALCTTAKVPVFGSRSRERDQIKRNEPIARAYMHAPSGCIPRMASATVVQARMQAPRTSSTNHSAKDDRRPDCRVWYRGHNQHDRGQQTRSARHTCVCGRFDLGCLSGGAKNAHQPPPAGAEWSDDGPAQAAPVEMCACAPIPPASCAQGRARRATGNAGQGRVGVHVTEAAAGSGQVDGSESEPKVNRHRRSAARAAAWRCK